MAAKPRAIIPPEPQLPAGAPQWAQEYAEAVRQYTAALLERLLAAETRLDKASIPE